MGRLVLFVPLVCLFLGIREARGLRPARPTPPRTVARPRAALLAAAGAAVATAAPEGKIETSSVTSQALLIAGTTIGGGFLALPRATAPAGFLPSALGLVLSWLYLLSSALSLADATLITKQLAAQNNGSDQRKDGEVAAKGEEEEVSVFRIAATAFGSTAAKATGLVFVVLMVSTLVAQLSKSGTLLADCLPTAAATSNSPAVCTLLFAGVMAAVTFGGGVAVAERANSALTSIMLASFGAVALTAARVAVPARLYRANWSMLLPSTSDSWSIPVLLQLLVYSETVPFVVRRLGGDRTKIRTAIAAGSAVPLLMCLVWTAAAIGAVPFDPLTFDPVQTLLAASSASFSSSQSLRLSILSLAGSAISTTVIGTLLASTQFLEDVFRLRRRRSSHAAAPTSAPERRDRLARWAVRAAALVPCALVSAFGSRRLYYLATAFAGQFPVTLLWGLLPPLAYLRLAQRLAIPDRPSLVLPVLNIALSVFMLAVNTAAALSP